MKKSALNSCLFAITMFACTSIAYGWVRGDVEKDAVRSKIVEYVDTSSKKELDEVKNDKNKLYRAVLKYPDVVSDTRKKLLKDDKRTEAKMLLRDRQAPQKEIKTMKMQNKTAEDAEKSAGEKWVSYVPEEYEIISDYNTRQRTQRYGKQRVFVSKVNTPGAKPQVTMDFVRDEKRVGRRHLVITYDAQGGEITYEFSFEKPLKRILKEANAIGWRMKGTVSLLDIRLRTETAEFSYPYIGLSDEWQDLLIPFISFSDGKDITLDAIRSIAIVIDGDRQQHPAGVLMLDDLMLGTFTKEGLRDVLIGIENSRYKDPTQFIKELYKQRKPF